jgi:hypothetical protein
LKTFTNPKGPVQPILIKLLSIRIIRMEEDDNLPEKVKRKKSASPAKWLVLTLRQVPDGLTKKPSSRRRS